MKKVKVGYDSNQNRWYYGETGQSKPALPNKKRNAVQLAEDLADELSDKLNQKVKLEVYKRDQDVVSDSPQRVKKFSPSKSTSKSSKGSGESYVSRKKKEFF